MVKRLKVLLTGPTGYLGRNILNFFDNRNLEISEFSYNDVDFLLQKIDYKNKSCCFDNHPKLNKKYDVLIHTAALPYSECEKEPQKANLVNYLLTSLLSNYCIKNNCFLIFFSSVQVYGTKLTGFYNEYSIVSPDTNYSVSKTKAEKYISKMIAEKDLKATTLRIGNVVGTLNNEFPKGWELFANSCIKDAVVKQEISIKNNPNLRRNFVPIDLLMGLLEKILDDYSNSNNLIPEILNVTTGKSKTLLEYSKLVSKKYKDIFRKAINIKYKDTLLFPTSYSVIENKKLKNYLSDFEEYSLEKTIHKTLNILSSMSI